MAAGSDPQELVLDETAAANPEEIELDHAEDDVEEAAGEAAEVAKQELGDDNSLFQADTLHNYDASAAVQAAPDLETQGTSQSGPHQQLETQHANGLSAALAAIVPSSPAASSPQQTTEHADG